MQQLVHYPANTQGRDFAVGDIHGYFDELETALEHIGFAPARDRLFSLGDLVDRGPQSGEVLQWLAQPWFHAIRGNHEEMTCAAIAGQPDAVQFHAANGGQWLAATPPETQLAILQALQALPLAIEVATAQGAVGLIHGDYPTDDWQDIRAGQLSRRDCQYALWSVARHQKRYARPINHIRAVLHGHMTVPTLEVLGNVYFLDTHHSERAAGQRGHFTLMELATLQAHTGPGAAWEYAAAQRQTPPRATAKPSVLARLAPWRR